jgi:hypothetical protein
MHDVPTARTGHPSCLWHLYRGDPDSSGEDSSLQKRSYTDEEIAELSRATGGDAPMLALADFSPGPWWGFNGIQALVLTADQLHVVPQGLALTRGRLRRSLLTADIQSVNWRTGQRFGLEVILMTLTMGHRRRTYTSRYQEGADLAAKLAEQVRPS